METFGAFCGLFLKVGISCFMQWFEFLLWNVWIVLWIGIQAVKMEEIGKLIHLRHNKNSYFELRPLWKSDRLIAIDNHQNRFSSVSSATFSNWTDRRLFLLLYLRETTNWLAVNFQLVLSVYLVNFSSQRKQMILTDRMLVLVNSQHYTTNRK